MSVRSWDRKRSKRNRVAYRRKPWQLTATAACIEYANACAGTGKTRSLARMIGIDLESMPTEIMQTENSTTHWLTGKGQGGGLRMWFIAACERCRIEGVRARHWEHA